MTGYEYEEFCADYLEKMGFYNIKVTKASGDQGVDITAFKNSIKYAFQCKYYESPVGNKAVQEVFAGKEFYDCQKAVVITNNTFTPSAVELANKNGVELWNSIYPTYDDHTSSNGPVSFIITEDTFKNYLPEDLHKKYYEYEQYFRDSVQRIDIEGITKGLSSFDHSKREVCKKCVETNFCLMAAAEHIMGVFLIDYSIGLSKTVFKFSKEDDIPIRDVLLKLMQSHFNYLSRNYNIYVDKIDSVSFNITVKGKPLFFDNKEEQGNYLRMLDESREEEVHLFGVNTIDDGNRSSVLYNKMVIKICDYLNYFICCIAGPDRTVLIDPLYITDQRIGLLSSTFCIEDNCIRFYFLGKLNNRARHDKRYKDVYDKGLLIVAKAHVRDYYIQNNDIVFWRAPIISYSFEDSGETALQKVLGVNSDNIVFVNKQLFYSSIDYDIAR